tara:strand:+ start:2531 stop:2875 length:345 start_codon:yes stop_codon:yes gene_type:complete
MAITTFIIKPLNSFASIKPKSINDINWDPKILNIDLSKIKNQNQLKFIHSNLRKFVEQFSNYSNNQKNRLIIKEKLKEYLNIVVNQKIIIDFDIHFKKDENQNITEGWILLYRI